VSQWYSRRLKGSANVRRPLIGLFGLFRLFGFLLVETNQMNQINQANKMNQTNQPVLTLHGYTPTLRRARYVMTVRERPESEAMQPASISMQPNGFIADEWNCGVRAEASLWISEIQ
jgi:hypothetical protein